MNDFATPVRHIDEDYLQQLEAIEDLVRTTPAITRFFNPNLTNVSSLHGLDVEAVVAASCNPEWRVAYPDGRQVTIPPAGLVVPPVLDLSPLRAVELIDEEGAAIAFHPRQAKEVDGLLDAATPGIPTLPSGFDLERPPRDPSEPQTTRDEGCHLSLSGAWFAVTLGLSLLMRRRMRRQGGSI